MKVCESFNHDSNITEDEHMTYAYFGDDTEAIICDECMNTLKTAYIKDLYTAMIRMKTAQENIKFLEADNPNKKPFKPYIAYGKYDFGLMTTIYSKSPFHILVDYILDAKVAKFDTDDTKKVTYDLSASVYVDTGIISTLSNGTVCYDENADHHQAELDFDEKHIVSYKEDEIDPEMNRVNMFIQEQCQQYINAAFTMACEEIDYDTAYKMAVQKAPCPCPSDINDYYSYTICGDGCTHSTNNPACNTSYSNDCLDSCNCPHHRDGEIIFRYPCSNCGNIIDSTTASCYYIIQNDMYCLRCAYAYIYKYGVEHHCFDKLGTGVICPCFDDADIEQCCDQMIKTGLFPDIRKITWKDGTIVESGSASSSSKTGCCCCTVMKG